MAANQDATSATAGFDSDFRLPTPANPGEALQPMLQHYGYQQLANLVISVDGRMVAHDITKLPQASIHLPGVGAGYADVLLYLDGITSEHFAAHHALSTEMISLRVDLQAARDSLTERELQLRQAEINLAAEQGRTAILEQVLKTFSTNATMATDARKHAVPTDPDKFTAQEKNEKRRYIQYRAWRDAIRMRWANDAHEFPTELKKILHAAGRLKDIAYERMANGLATILENLHDDSKWKWRTGEEFLAAMDRKYITIDIAAKAEQDLELLSQKGKWKVFSDFIAEFESLCEQCNLDDPAKVRYLRNKICPEVRDLVKSQIPQPERDDYEKWLKLISGLSRNCENDEFYRKRPLQDHHHESSTNSAKQDKNNNADPDAMDLDALNKVDPVEMKRRMDNRLCRRCGSADHWAVNCTPASRLPRGGGRGRGGGGGAPYTNSTTTHQNSYNGSQRGFHDGYNAPTSSSNGRGAQQIYQAQGYGGRYQTQGFSSGGPPRFRGWNHFSSSRGDWDSYGTGRGSYQPFSASRGQAIPATNITSQPSTSFTPMTTGNFDDGYTLGYVEGEVADDGSSEFALHWGKDRSSH